MSETLLRRQYDEMVSENAMLRDSIRRTVIELEEWQRMRAASEAKRAELAVENQRLRDGLAWYADETRYDDQTRWLMPINPRLGAIDYEASDIDEDRGERARALLATQQADVKAEGEE